MTSPTRARGVRRIAVAMAIAFLLVGTAAASWRSIGHRTPTDPAQRIATGLSCPACRGESVAESTSPIAAAMREVIAAQLADGRSPAEIRDWFIQRYGPEVLAVPDSDGLGLLLWLVPGGSLLVGAVLALRRPRIRSWARVATSADAARRTGHHPALRARRIWDLVAVCLVGLVAAIALASPRLTAAPGTSANTGDPLTAELALADSLERQGQYAAAADIYRHVVQQRPDDGLRLRLAFVLIRSGQPDDAQDIARQVLAARPEAPDALLMLGLAERDSGTATARQTLTRFLAVAPEHPAADEIRRLLDGG